MNPATYFREDSFIRFLAKRKGSTVYVVPYDGNSGDELIRMGIEFLLEQLGLHKTYNPAQANMLLWPGGNPTMWENNIEQWKECLQRWSTAEFVVGPATFEGDQTEWRAVLTNAKNIGGVFSRDPRSFENLTKMLPANFEIGIAHDPAFHLSKSDWLTTQKRAARAEHVLVSFRTDHEAEVPSYSGHSGPSFWPLSSITARLAERRRLNHLAGRLEVIRRRVDLASPLCIRDASAASFERFLEYVRNAKEVHTDRLHCMILAVLLGKKVFAYPTGYKKLEAVYEYSVRDWGDVEFVK